MAEVSTHTSEHARVLSWRLCVATGLSAVGGGTILTKGLELLPFGTVAAFLLGGCISLPIVKWHTTGRVGMMPAGAALLTLVLLSLHGLRVTDLESKIEGGLAVVVFAVLCCRYAFWFAARILRADVLAGHRQRIALVEVAYYVGLIIGFAVAEVGLIPTFVYALVLDVVLLVVAGTIDFVSSGLWQKAKVTVQPRAPALAMGVSEERGMSVYVMTVVTCMAVALFVALGGGSAAAAKVMAVVLLVIGAGVYEILATVFLDSIGEDERAGGRDGNDVALAYCAMTVVGAIALWALGKLPTYGWLWCYVGVLVVVWRAVTWPVRGEKERRRVGLWRRKATVVVVLTIGAQIIPLAAVVAKRSAVGGGYILAAFYAGAALGGMWSGVRKPRLVGQGLRIGGRIRYTME